MGGRDSFQVAMGCCGSLWAGCSWVWVLWVIVRCSSQYVRLLNTVYFMFVHITFFNIEHNSSRKSNNIALKPMLHFYGVSKCRRKYVS